MADSSRPGRTRCPVCGRTVDSQDKLRQHLETVHPGEARDELAKLASQPQTYACSVCGQTFDSMEALHEHENQKHPETQGLVQGKRPINPD